MTLEPLILKMISYDHGCPGRIQHFLKVHSFAKTIAVSEHLDEKTLFITEAAAIVHDIGIREAERKFGSSAGDLQEREGPPVAREILSSLGYPEPFIGEVCDIIASHHSPGEIDTDNFRRKSVGLGDT